MHPEAAACGAVVRAASYIVSELNAILKPHNLSEPSFNVLRILRGGPEAGMTCGEIGTRLVSRGPDVTRLIDRLERSELVARQRDEEDKRVVVVTILDSGRDVLAQLDEPVHALLAGFWNDVPGPERDAVVTTLKRLTDANGD